MVGHTTLGSRVFALSHLHVDYKENRKLLDGWPDKKYSNDVHVVAGDVTDNMTLLETTLKGLQLKFRQVFFVPGITFACMCRVNQQLAGIMEIIKTV